MVKRLCVLCWLTIFWYGNSEDNKPELSPEGPQAGAEEELEAQEATEKFFDEYFDKIDKLIDSEVMQLLPYNDEEVRENLFQEVAEEDLTSPGSVYRYRNLTRFELESSSTNKMYWIDRNDLRLASAPTVELGLWAAVAKSYDIVKAKFTQRYMDWRGARVIDRRIIRRLKRVAQNGCSLFPSRKEDSERKPEELAVVRHAEALIWAILKVYPVRAYFGSTPNQANRLFDWSASSLTDYFWDAEIRAPNCHVRFNTLSNIGLPRQFEWGSMNYYDVLERGLFELDQYDPFDLELTPLLRQFEPMLRSHDNEIRSWKIADFSDFDTVTNLIAKCLTYA